MQIVSAVDATYELIGQKEHGLERELAVAEVEEILQRRPEEIDDHRIVVAFGSEPPNERNTDATRKGLVHLRLEDAAPTWTDLHAPRARLAA